MKIILRLSTKRKMGTFVKQITIFKIITGLFVCSAMFAGAQGVGINSSGNPPDASAILDASSTTKGALIPRMTTVQRNAISTPAIGLIIYNLDINCIQFYNGNGNWIDLCSAPCPITPAAAGTVS